MQIYNVFFFFFVYVNRLTTVSNGSYYFVSICHPVPKNFYDPRKLAGALKLTPEGHSIVLGRIDHTKVINNSSVFYCKKF